MKKIVYILLSNFIIFLGISLLSTEVNAQTKPNVIVILADDLGTGDLNCYNPKSSIPTPAMDAIAEKGVVFTDAHSNSAVCTPSRYGILTGRYAWRSSLKSGVLLGYSRNIIEYNRTTIASYLKSKNYSTGAVGKWHLGMGMQKTGNTWDYSKPILNGPTTKGFDYFYGVSASLDMPPYVYIENDKFTAKPDEVFVATSFPAYRRGGDKYSGFDFQTVADTLMAKSVKFIQNHSNQSQPFFLYYPLTSPHKPVMPSPRFVGKSGKGLYGDFVMETDYRVEQIINTLKAEGIEDNTLVIITSDNGSYMYQYPEGSVDHIADPSKQGYTTSSHAPNYIYRGTKTDIYEAGHRVPFLVQWPANVSPRVVNKTICITDILETVVDINGDKLNRNEGEDSFSFLPLLENTGSYNRAPVVHHSAFATFALTKGDFKMVFGNGSGGRETPSGKAWDKPYQIYNLKNDPSETTNLINDSTALADKMENILIKIIVSGTSK